MTARGTRIGLSIFDLGKIGHALAICLGVAGNNGEATTRSPTWSVH